MRVAARAPRCSRARSARPSRARAAAPPPPSGPAHARCGSSASVGADLLVAAAKHPTFPMLLETTRECLRDVFDVPALREVMARPPLAQDEARGGRHRARVAVRAVAAVPAGSPSTCTRATRRSPSDAPPRSRSTATCCASCSATEELRDLLDPAALDELELELQGLAEGRRARNADDVHDLLRERRRPDRGRDRGADGAATRPRGSSRCSPRAARSACAWRARTAPGRGRGCRGAARRARRLPPDRPARRVHRADGAPARDAGRPLRPHARAVPGRPRSAARLGAGADRVRAALEALEASGRVTHGEFRPARRRARMVRRRRAAAAPSPFARGAPQGGRAGRRRHARAVPARRGRARDRPGERPRRADGRDRAPAGRGGARLDPGADVLPARVRGFRPADLDALCASGDLVWIGAGPLGADDGRVVAVRPRPGAAARAAAARGAADGRRCTWRSASTSPTAAHRSGPIWCRRPGPATNASCSPRSGTWSGRARSRTTRWRRSGR